MRFYLDLPLVVGYSLMATLACVGVLQFAALRGGYRGMSLFAANPKTGARIGAGLTVGSLIAYVLFAPEILTPGPAGTEVAGMFAVCALVALALTLVGADLRLRRTEIRPGQHGKRLHVSHIPATLFLSFPNRPKVLPLGVQKVPVVILILDPTRFFATPGRIVQELCDVGLAVLVLDTQYSAQRSEPLAQSTLSECLSTAIRTVEAKPTIDEKRIGVLAVGWAADLMLNAEGNDIDVNAVMVVSPVACVPLKPGMTAPGVGWLRDLGYGKAWRWRQRGAKLIYEAQVMALRRDSRSVQVEQGCPILATRNSDPAEPLPVKSQRYFAILDDNTVRQLVVQWFQELLAGGG